jgi:formate dehydrogenase major subunit
VGCAQIVTVNDAGKVIDVQGHPESPINQGTLCPKGAATYQLAINDLRLTKVKYRAPGSDHWEDKPLDWAMNRIADLVKKTRDANFNKYQDIPDGKGKTVKKRVMNTYAIASLGGATMDNEWNYAHQKLMHALGVVYLENQARV